MLVGFGALLLPGVVEAADCGQGCHYQRANEILILQTKYLINKVNALAGMKNDQARKGELRAFCEADRNKGADGANNAKECWRNYLMLVRRSLRSLRTSIAQNYDAVVKLAANTEDVAFQKGQPESAEGAVAAPELSLQLDPDDPKGAKAPLSVPVLPELQQLDPIFQKFGRLLETEKQGALSQQASQTQALDRGLYDWWDRYPKCPSPDEFIEVEQVERYPSHPTGEKITRVKTGPDGKVKTDEKAYDKAFKLCQDKRKDWLKSAPANPGVVGAADGKLASRLLEEPSPASRKAFESAQKELATVAKGLAPEGAGKTQGGGQGLQPALATGGQQPGKQDKKELYLFLPDDQFDKADGLVDQLLKKLD